MKGDALDPKGLIAESYRIDGITREECRSIFVDWALSMPMGSTEPENLQALLARYGDAHPAHPMTETLREGLTRPGRPKRRGGWRSRAR